MICLTRPPFVPTINSKYDEHRVKILSDIHFELYHLLGNGIISKGEKVKEFEERVAKYVGTKYAIAINSCTSGLQVVLEALDIGLRDKVICPNFTYPSTRLAIENVGAIPVFVDVEDDYCSWEHDDLFNKRVMGQICVDLFGNYSSWGHCCNDFCPPTIRDAACGIGLNYKPNKVRYEEHYVFSFHPRKIISTGEGGMICTNNPELADRIRLLVGYGKAVTKYNLRMSDVNAVIGLVQMNYIDDIIRDRRRAAKIYDDLIDDHLKDKFRKHPRQEGINQTFQSYVGMLCNYSYFSNNKQVIVAMKKRGVELQIGSYFVNSFSFYTSDNGYNFYLGCLSLPMYYCITEEEQQEVITKLKEVIS